MAKPVTVKSQADLLRAADKFGVPRGAALQGAHRIAVNTFAPLAYQRSLLTKTVPEAWERELRALSPITEHTSHLRFVWVQDPNHMDKARWVLYECVPDALIPTEMRVRLGGTPYWELPPTKRGGRSQMVSALQWELYRVYRVWARPFWCLQGDAGGTPCEYTELERQLNRLHGLPNDPPGLGALPYTGWNGKVRDAVAQRDRLAKLAGRIEALRATGNATAMAAEEAAIAREVRKHYMQWWADQLQEETDFLRWYGKKCEADRTIKRATAEEARAAAMMEEQYIETGVIPHVADPDDVITQVAVPVRVHR